MSAESSLAPAKINLYLHVLGRRADGYHLIESLIAFASFGDRLSVAPAEDLTLQVTGPAARQISSVPLADNIVMVAARLLREAAGRSDLGAAITLEKRIPAAAGLGGGSSDAATALRLLKTLWGLTIGEDELAAIGLRLGADVPVCLAARPSLVRGIGEVIEPAPVSVAGLPIVIAHTGDALPTADVFRKLTIPETLAAGIDSGLPLVEGLALTRNDLVSPAALLQADITRLLGAISATADCRLARMSGSGAACFGVYGVAARAAAAATVLRRDGWWAQACELLGA